MRPKNLVVFDMDGVLVDVSASYREATRTTARCFFAGAPAYDKLPDPLFSLEELAQVKQSGGLNNDWETTYRVIALLLKRVDLPNPSSEDDPWRFHRQFVAGCDLSNLAAFLRSRPDPLSDLLRQTGTADNRFVNQLSSGDVGSGNVIKQIFQERYLGKNLFEATYGLPVKTYFGSGLIANEQLLTERAVVERLSGQHLLAIATGRPRSEALFPLNRFDIKRFFQTVLTLDDCLEAERRQEARTGKHVSLSKPHPFMLNVIAQAFTGKVQRNYYVGDMPDDMLAARSAACEFAAVGFIGSSPDKPRARNLLIQAGAHRTVADFKELEAYLAAGQRP